MSAALFVRMSAVAGGVVHLFEPEPDGVFEIAERCRPDILANVLPADAVLEVARIGVSLRRGG